MADYTIANGGSLLLGGGTLSNTTTVGGPQYGYYGGFQATSDLFTGYLTGGQIVATGLQAGWTLQTFNTGGFYFLQVIPEPETYAMFALGAVLMGVAVLRRRRQDGV